MVQLPHFIDKEAKAQRYMTLVLQSGFKLKSSNADPLSFLMHHEDEGREYLESFWFVFLTAIGKF